MDFKKASEQIEEYVIHARRHFHQHPELPFKEVETTAYIVEELKKMGLEPQTFPDYTGCWAMIRGGSAGENPKTVALRADIDALPVEEKTGLPFASQNEGVMHACGHDCHAAMLLGAAKLLKDAQPELKGNVKLLFQAAEESCHGAEYYVQNGFFKDVDAVYGSHVIGNLKQPYLNCQSGARMASCDNFKITVTGVSSHGSTPHTGRDAIASAAAIINQLQTIVSRRADPSRALVITVGEIHGGQRFNIIANKVVMEGTVRCNSNEIRNQVEGWMRDVVTYTAKAMGTEAVLDYAYFCAPVINDEHLTELVQKAAVDMYGENALGNLDSAMGSEDFAYFLSECPGVYMMIGSHNEEMGYVFPNHNDHYTVDESILKKGTAMYARFAADFLAE